jgi:threonylcarbamoyladenosine tRNA methylthiotransferase MtaB
MPTFHIEQFGCRATQADGAAIERQLLDRGCTLANSSSAADVVVLNTCTVTAAADAQARDAIRKLHTINPATQIIVTGCYAQRAPEELAALPGVSVVVGNSHKPQIPDLISPLVPPTNLVPANFIAIASLLESQVSCPVGTRHVYRGLAAMPVPATDPDSIRSVPRAAILVGNIFDLETVLQEIRNLSDSGYKEIVLSGINLGAWGRDLSPRQNFLDLLRQILDETEVARLRLSSIEPLDVTRDLIALFASSARLAQHFHMPLQSASARILAAMHRWYRSEHYARRIDFIHEQLPHAGIGADIIAGFPGETEDDHTATMNFVASRPFTYLHVFSYSARPGTRAANLPDQLSGAIIKRRARELRELSEKKSSAFHRLQSGRTLSLLTLRHSDSTESSEWTPALSSNFLKLRLSGSWQPNQFVDAICSSRSHSLCVPSVQKRAAAHLELI